MRGGRLCILMAAVCVGATGVVAGVARDASGTALCKPTIVKTVVHYCGPAKARLSVFPSVTFKNGTCKRQTVDGAPLLLLGLGARSQNAATNNGLTYFGLSVAGPPSHPTGGGVIAYYKGKRWGGRGVSFRGTATAGTFVARGINGSRGTASGSFHC